MGKSLVSCFFLTHSVVWSVYSAFDRPPSSAMPPVPEFLMGNLVEHSSLLVLYIIMCVECDIQLIH